jgi:hypothetical protein
MERPGDLSLGLLLLADKRRIRQVAGFADQYRYTED